MKTVRLPYPPSTNRLWRNGGGVQYMPPEVKRWKRTAAMLAKAAGFSPIGWSVSVSIQLHPKLTKTRKASKTCIDLDNAIKATLDGLNGIAWQDDKQVVQILAEVGDPIPDGGLTISIGAATA